MAPVVSLYPASHGILRRNSKWDVLRRLALFASQESIQALHAYCSVSPSINHPAVAYVRIGLSLNRSEARKHSKQPRALSKARRRENIQVVRTIASIVVIVARCMFPKHLASLYYYFGKNSPDKAIFFRMLTISEIFAVLHSCLNPLVSS